MKKKVIFTLTSCLVLILVFGTLFSGAQERRWRGDPEQMREMIMQRMQQQLGATDEEWNVLQPMLEKVWELQRESRAGGFMRGFFRPPRPDGDRPERRGDDDGRRFGGRGFGPEPMPEAIALHEALEEEDASAEVIKEKLDAYREAQQKKEDALKEAQDELKKALTVRQEAILVLMGTLE